MIVFISHIFIDVFIINFKYCNDNNSKSFLVQDLKICIHFDRMNQKCSELNQGAFSRFPRTSILKALIMRSWFLHDTSPTELSLDSITLRINAKKICLTKHHLFMKRYDNYCSMLFYLLLFCHFISRRWPKNARFFGGPITTNLLKLDVM